MEERCRFNLGFAEFEVIAENEGRSLSFHCHCCATDYQWSSSKRQRQLEMMDFGIFGLKIMMTGVVHLVHSLIENFKKEKNRGLTQSLENVNTGSAMEGNYTQKRGQRGHGQRKTVVWHHGKITFQ